MNNMKDEMLDAIHRYHADKNEIILHFGGNRKKAFEAIRGQAKASRCSVKVAASLLLARLKDPGVVVSGVDSEDMQAIERHENDR